MKLTDLNARFLNQPDGPQGVGVEIDCPCGKCGFRLFVAFKIALDGKPTLGEGNKWERKGDTFETLTLSPSVQRVQVPRKNAEAWKLYPLGTWPGDCAWHGHIVAGEAVSC